MKKLLAGAAAAFTVISAAAFPTFAATVDLPPEFSDLTPIFEIVLKLVEFLAKIAFFFTGATR